MLFLRNKSRDTEVGFTRKAQMTIELELEQVEQKKKGLLNATTTYSEAKWVNNSEFTECSHGFLFARTYQ